MGGRRRGGPEACIAADRRWEPTGLATAWIPATFTLQGSFLALREVAALGACLVQGRL